MNKDPQVIVKRGKEAKCHDCGEEKTLSECRGCREQVCTQCKKEYHSGELRLGCASAAGRKLVDELSDARKHGSDPLHGVKDLEAFVRYFASCIAAHDKRYTEAERAELYHTLEQLRLQVERIRRGDFIHGRKRPLEGR